MPNVNIIVIEGNQSSGKTYLLQKLKDQYGEENITYKDFDEINLLLRSGPPYFRMSHDEKLQKTNQAIEELIHASIEKNKKIVLISGISVWNGYDFFEKNRFKQHNLVKSWYEVDPIESVVRYIFRWSEAPESDKQAVKNYLEKNKKLSAGEIDLRNVNVIDLDSFVLAYYRFQTLTSKNGVAEDATLDFLIRNGKIRHGIARDNLINDYGYVPRTAEQIGDLVETLLTPSLASLKNQLNDLIKGLKQEFQKLYTKRDGGNNNYQNVSLAAKKLEDALILETNSFFEKLTEENYKKRYISFKETCIQSIDIAEKEFKNHREFWHKNVHQIIKAILGVITGIVTMLPVLIGSALQLTEIKPYFNWMATTFFSTPETNSSKKLKEFKTALEKTEDTLMQVENQQQVIS